MARTHILFFFCQSFALIMQARARRTLDLLLMWRAAWWPRARPDYLHAPLFCECK
jgi:hypothetical protein